MTCRVCEAECKGAFLCRPCGSEIERAIGDMPALLAELDVTVAKLAKTYRSAAPERHQEPLSDPESHLQPFLRSRDGRIALRATALPVNLDAADVRWDVLNTLGTWARHLAESRGVDAPVDDALIGFLLANVESLRFDEAAAEAHDEITYAHRQLTHAIDRSPERIYAGPCRTEHAEFCCVRDLYARPDGEIVCDGHRSDREGCGAEHGVAERAEFLRAAVCERLLTLDEAIDALSLWRLDMPKRGSINGWIRDGRLAPHGLNRAGEPTYSLLEFIDLVTRHATRVYAPRPSRRKTA